LAFFTFLRLILIFDEDFFFMAFFTFAIPGLTTLVNCDFSSLIFILMLPVLVFPPFPSSNVAPA